MRNVILLMLFCGSANAGIYSCVDNSGKKVLRSVPCEHNEKQQPIVIKAPPSHYVINSTGEKQGMDSYQAKQAPRSIAQSAAPKNLYELAKAEANSSGDQSPEIRAGIMDRVIRAYRAEHCGANAQAQRNDSSQQSLYDRAKAEANSSQDQRSEVRAGIMNRFIRAYRAERCMPEDARDEANSSRSAINTQTGEFMPGVPGGVINPRTGAFFPAVTGGFINPATGQFFPAQ